MAGVSALPGVIMIVVGYLIGDDFLIVVCTAAGASSSACRDSFRDYAIAPTDVGDSNLELT